MKTSLLVSLVSFAMALKMSCSPITRDLDDPTKDSLGLTAEWTIEEMKKKLQSLPGTVSRDIAVKHLGIERARPIKVSQNALSHSEEYEFNEDKDANAKFTWFLILVVNHLSLGGEETELVSAELMYRKDGKRMTISEYKSDSLRRVDGAEGKAQ